MRINIATKLFFGFLIIIAVNTSSIFIVSNMSSLTKIASLVQQLNSLKNNFLEFAVQHKGQTKSYFIYTSLKKNESANEFLRKGIQKDSLLNVLKHDIESIMQLDSAISSTTKHRYDTGSVTLFNFFSTQIEDKNRGYNQAFREYTKEYGIFLANKKDAKALQTMGVLHSIMLEMDSTLQKNIGRIGTTIDLQTTTLVKEIESRITYVNDLMQLMYLSMLIFSIGFALLFSRYISNSLRRLKESSSVIGKGDFSFTPMGYPNDEIGDLANAFYEMAHDLKKTQDELIKKRRLAAIGEIVASVNHEINNPLMIISGNAQYLEMTIEKGITADTKDRIRAIIEETERISQVTRKLRDIKNPVVEDYTSSGEQMINLDKSLK